MEYLLQRLLVIEFREISYQLQIMFKNTNEKKIVCKLHN